MSSILTEKLGAVQARISLSEATDSVGAKGKSLYMSGLFIQGDVRNHNQRIYPKSEIMRAVKALNKRIDEGFSVIGEVDHPENLGLNIDRVSHTIEKMWMEGADGHGKLRILPTPMGNIIRILLDNQVRLGVSSRGSGDVDHKGIVSDFDIVTVDIVATPSAPNAYPKALYESLMNMNGGAKLHEAARHFNFDDAANRYVTNEIKKFIRELGKK